MYNNIGLKIKILAVIIFVIESLAIFICGLSMCIYLQNGIYFLIALLGPIIAWISSWLIYGFGEIIDKLGEIEENTRPQVPPFQQAKNETAWQCDTCGNMRTQTPCEHCGDKFSDF